MDIWGFLIWSTTEAPLAVIRDILLVLIFLPLIVLELIRIVLEALFFARPGTELYIYSAANIWSMIKQIIFVLLSLSPIWWSIWLYRLLMLTLQNLLRLLPQEWAKKWDIWPLQKKPAYKGFRVRDDAKNLTFFVNGICVDKNWLALNCKTLEAYLGGQVVGIHNQTFGMIIDLVECILQRDLRFYTESVQQAIDEIVPALENVIAPAKVRLIGHSQGGIIVSLVVDYLVYYRKDLLANLEVYTFASAADKFVAIPAPNQGIPVKHYGNQFDLVAIIGSLGRRLFYRYIRWPLATLYGENLDPNVDPLYWGDVFYRPGGFGHLLSTNYVFARNPSPYIQLNGGITTPF